MPLPCLASLLGKSKKQPWLIKKLPYSIYKKYLSPGSFISIDQLISSIPRIKPQSASRLTNIPIIGVQVFIDNSSTPPFLYSYLLENFTLDETLKAKVAFEHIATLHNITITKYHADNGRFADTGFIKACNVSNQVIDFCSVNAYF